MAKKEHLDARSHEAVPQQPGKLFIRTAVANKDGLVLALVGRYCRRFERQSKRFRKRLGCCWGNGLTAFDSLYRDLRNVGARGQGFPRQSQPKTSLPELLRIKNNRRHGSTKFGFHNNVSRDSGYTWHTRQPSTSGRHAAIPRNRGHPREVGPQIVANSVGRSLVFPIATMISSDAAMPHAARSSFRFPCAACRFHRKAPRSEATPQ